MKVQRQKVKILIPKFIFFRNRYPEGENYVIYVDGDKNFVKKF